MKVRSRPATREQEFQAYINLCFAMLEKWSWAEVAHKTGLSLTTIHRLASGSATLATRFGTIQSLGRAAGLSFNWTRTKAHGTVRLSA